MEGEFYPDEEPAKALAAISVALKPWSSASRCDGRTAVCIDFMYATGDGCRAGKGGETLFVTCMHVAGAAYRAIVLLLCVRSRSPADHEERRYSTMLLLRTMRHCCLFVFVFYGLRGGRRAFERKKGGTINLCRDCCQTPDDERSPVPYIPRLASHLPPPSLSRRETLLSMYAKIADGKRLDDLISLFLGSQEHPALRCVIYMGGPFFFFQPKKALLSPFAARGVSYTLSGDDASVNVVGFRP